MAFIKCPVCGRAISSRFAFCLGCRTPMSKINYLLNASDATKCHATPSSHVTTPATTFAQQSQSNRDVSPSEVDLTRAITTQDSYPTPQFSYEEEIENEECYDDKRSEDDDFDLDEALAFENYIRDQMKYDPEYYYGSEYTDNDDDDPYNNDYPYDHYEYSEAYEDINNYRSTYENDMENVFQGNYYYSNKNYDNFSLKKFLRDLDNNY